MVDALPKIKTNEIILKFLYKIIIIQHLFRYTISSSGVNRILNELKPSDLPT